MIENLETLLALSRTGTMMEASTELRISQSAVSKRLATLEKYYDRKLIQKKGRRVELTQHGQRLVDRIGVAAIDPLRHRLAFILPNGDRYRSRVDDRLGRSGRRHRSNPLF